MGKSVEEVLETEWDEDFVIYMRNRMLMSFYKYGYVEDSYGVNGEIDAIESMRERIKEYEKTGNLEYLVDTANFCLIEYMCPSREDAYFKSTDSDGSIGRERKED